MGGGVTQLADSLPAVQDDWEGLIEAARRVAGSAGEPGAGPRYASEFGLALLDLARASSLPTDERDLLYSHAEFWLTEPRSRAVELLDRLARQLATYRHFSAVPLTMRQELERLAAVLHN